MTSRVRLTTTAALTAAGICATGAANAAADVPPPPFYSIARDTSATPPGGLPCTRAVPSVGGIACFDKRGDKMWVLDTATDGYNVYAVFATPTGWAGSCDDYHGVGAGWTVCDNLDSYLRERDTLTFRVKSRGTSAWVRTPVG